MSAASGADHVKHCVAPLFVPANRLERFSKAAASGADAVIIDLEDALPSADKAAARNALTLSALRNVTAIIRINGHGTPWHEDDCAAVARLAPAAVMLPKAEVPEHIVRLSARTGLPVLALIETARGLDAAKEIARLGVVVRLVFGSVDFAADLGTGLGHEPLLYARSKLVLASRLGSLTAPLDGVTLSLEGTDVANDAAYAAELGFGGKLCIHPMQIAPTFQGFRPSEENIAAAREIITLGEDPLSLYMGQLVDRPVRQRALSVLKRAEQRT